MTGKRRLALELLAAGHDRGDGAIVISTKDSAGRLIDEYETIAGGAGDAEVAVVDAVTRQQGRSNELDEPWVRYASSPDDMTGIGMQFSELLEEFVASRGLAHNRILFYSLSTLLMYADLQTVFRFLHVMTGRVSGAGGLGVYVIDSTAHEERVTSTLNQLFDGVVNVEESADGGDPTVVVRGL